MAQPTPSLYALDPALPVLLRPDGAVQVGWSPRRAVVIHPPRGLTPAGLATLLRTMHSPAPMSELQRQAGGGAGRSRRATGRGGSRHPRPPTAAHPLAVDSRARTRATVRAADRVAALF